jgi:hypothetical protein
MEDWWIITLLVFNSFPVILRACRRSHITISWTFAVVPAFRKVEGHQLVCWRSSRPSLNHLNHSNTGQKPVYEREHCHNKPFFSSCEVLVAILPILKWKFMFIPLSLQTVTMICMIENLKHNWAWMTREVTDLVQGIRRKSQLTQTSWNMFQCWFKWV